MPKVSIVIPIYMVEKYIEQCLNSIVTQTFFDIEIVLVDDRGTDRSVEIAKEFAKNDSRIKIIKHDKNKGLRHAVFSGINASLSEYIMFADSDDYVKSDYVEVLYNAIKKYNVDCVSSGFIEVYQDKEKDTSLIETKVFSKQLIEKEILFKYFEVTENYHDIFGNSRVGKIYKTKVLKAAVCGANEKITVGEDLELNARFLLKANSIATLSDYKGYCYRQSRDDSMSNRYSLEKLMMQDVLFDEIKKLAQNYHYKGAVIGRELVRSCDNHMRFCLDTQTDILEKTRMAQYIIDRVSKSEAVSREEKNRWLAVLTKTVTQGNIPRKLKLELVKRLKQSLSNKNFLLELSKSQPIMGNIFYKVLYFNLEALIVYIMPCK